MKNITVSVADQTYREARIWFAENKTSVSAAVEYMLEHVRSILSVRKLPRRPRRHNRYQVPPELATSSLWDEKSICSYNPKSDLYAAMIALNARCIVPMRSRWRRELVGHRSCLRSTERVSAWRVRGFANRRAR